MKSFGKRSGRGSEQAPATDDDKSSTDTVMVRTLAMSGEGSYPVEEGPGLEDTVTARTLALVDRDDFADEADPGIDPYNTSRTHT